MDPEVFDKLITAAAKWRDKEVEAREKKNEIVKALQSYANPVVEGIPSMLSDEQVAIVADKYPVRTRSTNGGK